MTFLKIDGVVKEFKENKKEHNKPVHHSVTSMEHLHYLSCLKQFEVLVDQNTRANAMLQLMF